MIWYVALGSALGGVARYLMSTAVMRAAGPGWPAGTLAVNVLGALVIGFVLQLELEDRGLAPGASLFLTAGFCGGFTTFSAFSWEALQLLQRGGWARAGWYAALSVGLCLVAVAGGAALARAWLARA